ncbi:Uncharacterised protein [Halioglobus japonicus]|nr:Uncharacterised protein [Halioglobus japonicus]
MFIKNSIRLAILLCCYWVSSTSLAEQTVRISEPSRVDLQFMEEQRQSLQDLAASNLGRQFSGDKERDLALLQALLDEQLVRPDQVRELQAMGVIMGDLLADDLGMHWVIYEDRQGRSRALRWQESDNYLFPITMIARRREVGNTTPVVEIYQKAYDIIDESRPALPFQ